MTLRIKHKILAAVVACLCSTASMAQTLYEHFPDQIHGDQEYVIYSHGFIVEGSDPTPEHAEYGIYEFPSIKKKLASGGNYKLIAHHRPANIPVGNYANSLAGWVSELMQAGVPAQSITLVGFSRGSYLTANAAAILQQEELNIVLMASCFNGTVTHYESNEPLSLKGKLLSIYETTDSAGSCRSLADDSQLRSFQEIAISTGRKHGAFYTPISDWVDPLLVWINKH